MVEVTEVAVAVATEAATGAVAGAAIATWSDGAPDPWPHHWISGHTIAQCWTQNPSRRRAGMSTQDAASKRC